MGEKHTPGPWFEDEAGICAESWGVVAQANYPESYWDRGGSEMTKAEESEHAANSRLIAAAPDLLEALSALLAEVEDANNEDHDVIIAANAAIARATRPSGDEGAGS